MKSSFAYRSLIAGLAATVLVGNVAATAMPGPSGDPVQDQDRPSDLAHRAANQVDNASITARVKAALMASDRAEAFNINVDTDGQGVVTLRGTADSQQARQAATDVARQVGGVASVNNELVVSSDRTTNPQTMTAQAQAAGEDGWLTTKVKTALINDGQVSANDVNVETNRGRVILTGMVPTEAAKQSAISRARSVEGVEQVDASKLKVDASATVNGDDDHTKRW